MYFIFFILSISIYAIVQKVIIIRKLEYILKFEIVNI